MLSRLPVQSALCAGGVRRSSSRDLRSAFTRQPRDRIWLGIFKHILFIQIQVCEPQPRAWTRLPKSMQIRYFSMAARELIRCYDRFACMYVTLVGMLTMWMKPVRLKGCDKSRYAVHICCAFAWLRCNTNVCKSSYAQAEPDPNASDGFAAPSINYFCVLLYLASFSNESWRKHTDALPSRTNFYREHKIIIQRLDDMINSPCRDKMGLNGLVPHIIHTVT